MQTIHSLSATGAARRRGNLLRNAPSQGRKRAVRYGTAASCEACEISIMTIAAPSPVLCPFCGETLHRGAYKPHPPTPVPEEALAAHTERYHVPAKPIVGVLDVAIVLLLAIAAYLKLHCLEYYWYQPWLNAYSITVGVFILSRFMLAALYVPPPDVGYEPSLSVVVACRNEVGAIEKTIERIYLQDYPAEKLQVVVVNDGSTDGTLEEMLRAQGRHPNLTVVDFVRNKGKRHGMAVGTRVADAEVVVFVDSDSFLLPGALRKVVQGLADPTVAAVSGHTDVENLDTNLLTKMQDVRYYVSYRVMKAAEHVFGCVSCCPGCFSAYRRDYVNKVLDAWLHQQFLGRTATYGDDRSLTNHLLRDYKVLYDDEALATTIVPENWRTYIRQQARWKRSWIREFFVAGIWFWRKHPIAALSWYVMTLLPLLGPLVVFNALVLGPLFYDRAAGFYVGGVLSVTLLWALYYLKKTGRSGWWTAFVFIVTYILFFSWQGYYALGTVRRTHWGTR